MSKTFEMPVNAKKGCLELANEMLRVGGETLMHRDDLLSLARKVATSMDTPEITLEPGEITAMFALGECADLLQISRALHRAEDAEGDTPELSKEQVMEYAVKVLECAPETEKDSEVYKATLSLLNTVTLCEGEECELTPQEDAAYQTLKQMYHSGAFGK